MRHLQAVKAGFTLIELLVVVAIIAVLAGLLIPGVALARSKAREVQCMSSLRQVGMAATAYSGDYRGVVVPSNLNQNEAGARFQTPTYAWGVVWQDLLIEYNGKDGSAVDRQSGVTWGCPARNKDPLTNRTWTGYGKCYFPFAEEPATWPDDYYTDSHRIANSPDASSFKSEAMFRLIYESQVVNPASRIMVSDSTNWNIYFWPGTPGEELKNSLDYDRHRGSSNCLYYDGHVARVAPKNLYNGLMGK